MRVMIILLLADIHSNIVALREVLKDAGEWDLVLCAGDLVGYNPWPREVLSIMRGLKAKVVLGNHDLAAVTGVVTDFNPMAAEAIHFTRSQLTQEDFRYLSSLPKNFKLKVEGVRVCMYHGSPIDPINEYIYPDVSREVLKLFIDEAEAEILILGHTHIPMKHEIEGYYVINPGAVGQSRDGDPRASYMILELGGNKALIKYRRVKYNLDEVANAIINVGLPKLLAFRLYYGR